MPTLCECLNTTRGANDADNRNLAFRPMGYWYNRTTPYGKEAIKFLIVAIDYFTKWVKVEPITTIKEANITSFVWKNIVRRFGIPNVIISDNGRQFDNPKFWKFCQDLGIKNHYSSLRQPQANGQTEVTNRSLLKIIKTRLEGAKGAWPEEPPNVLWAY